MSDTHALVLRTLYVLLAISTFFLYRDERLTKAIAASAQAQATAQVIRAIAISKTSDLDFGEATPGAPAQTVFPGNSENSQNASFVVVGEPNRSYSIIVPGDGEVSMVTGDGDGPAKHIGISGFQSYPPVGSNGTLDADGQQILFIGATRSALIPEQALGRYTGAFTVTVIY
jgi:hypothetical protein